MNNREFFKTAFLVLSMLNSTAFSNVAFAGGESGGGGDASEARVNEIRSDILSWINKGEASGLKLPITLSRSQYETEMKKILKPQAVIISFVEKDDALDEEKQVSVARVAKTCRGFLSRVDARPHILCNISRFQNTKEADQYRLIHHEYAGLAMVEKNDGAASDYEISNQLTSFLKEEKVLRLSLISSNVKTGMDDPNSLCLKMKNEGFIQDFIECKKIITDKKFDANALSVIRDINPSQKVNLALKIVANHNFPLELIPICQNLEDYNSSHEYTLKCLEMGVETHFSPALAGVLYNTSFQGRQNFIHAMLLAKFGHFDSVALELCQRISQNSDGAYCLAIIDNNKYDHDALNYCKAYELSINCLNKSRIFK